MGRGSMEIIMKPIGIVSTLASKVPRHWTVSDVEGFLLIDEKYLEGLKDITSGQKIVVLFYFHRSPQFTSQFLTQTPPHRKERLGVFSICSPIRPNPIGLSVLDVIDVERSAIRVRGIDMYDGTPILDIKPLVQDKDGCSGVD
jgi:tRNA-Thr(GGU) m(6)t(6)A37 methyltransferase TsaA